MSKRAATDFRLTFFSQHRKLCAAIAGRITSQPTYPAKCLPVSVKEPPSPVRKRNMV